MTKAKLEHGGIVFHHLRHTAASWMVMGGPLLTVAKILGHSDIKMVMRIIAGKQEMGKVISINSAERTS